MTSQKKKVKTALKRGANLIKFGAKKLSLKRRSAIIPTAVGLGAALGFALDHFVIIFSAVVAIGVAIYMLSADM